VKYLLDANAVVALLRNKPAQVRERYRRAEASGDWRCRPSSCSNCDTA
jgi:hypothetical protein